MMKRIGQAALVAITAAAAVVVVLVMMAGEPVEADVIKACLEETIGMDRGVLEAENAWDDAHRNCLAQGGRHLPPRVVMELVDHADRALWRAVRTFMEWWG